MEITTSTKIVKNELVNFLKNINIKKFLLAFSGGIDSSVLLHALNNLKEDYHINIRCIHINHHLNNNSLDYFNHCVNIFKKYNVAYITGDIHLNGSSNVEEKLREKRYKLITDEVKDDEFILTAHHFDDQVETFFLRLMRGSSPSGLSCMDIFSYINSKPIARPLLKLDKSIIKNYSADNKVEYIDDITNNLNDFDRNYIRNKVLPLLNNRWKSLNKIMSNNIQQQKIKSYLAKEYMQSKIIKLYNDNNSNELLSAKLIAEDINIQPSLLHEWIKTQTNVSLYNNQIHEILKSVVKAKNDSHPLFEYKTIKITKTQGIIYLEKIKS